MRVARRSRGVVLSLGIFAELVGRTVPAAAEEANRAEQLFVQGVAGLKAGSFETACAALEASHVLEAKLGTLLALADCLDRWGKAHSAVARYEQYVSAVSDLSAEERSEREEQLRFARAALARLQPSVPHLLLVSPAALAAGAQVFLDERPVPIQSPEEDVALDPGQHVITTQAPGHAPWRTQLDLAWAEHARVELELGSALVAEKPEPILVLPAQPAPSIASAQATPQQPALTESGSPIVGAADAPRPEAGSGTGGTQWRSLGWALGGLSLASLGVGTVAGVMVLETCPSFECASREQRGRNLALVADVGFGVGIAALVASIVVLLQTQPGADAAATSHWQPRLGVQAGGGWIGMDQQW
jgi:hypothetical protein